MKKNDEHLGSDKACHALEQNEKKYRMMFEHSSAGIAVHEVILDKNDNVVDYTFVDINPAYEKMTGLKKENVIGKRVREIIPNIEEKWFDIYGKVALTGESASFIEHSDFLDKYWNIRAFSPEKYQFAITMVDISEQVNTRHNLIEAKEIAEKYLELSGSIILALDNQGNITMINTRGVELLGYKNKDELIGKNWFEACLPPQEIKTFKPKFKKIINKQSDQSKYVEAWVLTKSGEKKLISWYNTLIKDDNENIIGTLSSGFDISQRWKAEKKTQESEAQYRSYIDHAPNAVFIVNEKGNYIQANPAAEKITGYTINEILKMNIMDFSPDEESIAIGRKGFQELQEKGEISINLTYKRKNGSIGWWNVNAVKLSDNRYMGFSSDITREIEAKLSLKNSEEKFRYAMEAAVDGIWDWDIKTDKVFFSRGWEKILGLIDQESYLDIWRKRIHPEDKITVLNSINACLNGESESWECDHRLKHENGNWIWVKGKGKVVEYDETGKPKRMVGAAINIDEKMRAEKRMEEQKILLDSIIDHSPFPTFISDNTGVMIRVNKALLNTLNYKEEQLVGVYNLLTDVNLIEQGTISLIRDVFNKHHTVQFVQFWEKEKIGIQGLRGGKDLYIDVTIFPIVNTQGVLEHVVTQWIDITEQTIAEQKIRESEEKYRFLVENQNDLIVTIDTHHKITFANPNYCRIFGVEEKDVLDHSFIPLIHKDDIENVKASLESVKTPPYTSYHEERAKTANGWRWFGWSLKANLDKKGIITQIVAVGRDITNRKQAEEEKSLSESRFRELVNTINSGVAVYKVINDGKSGNDYIIQDFNKTALELEERADVIGKSLKDIRPNIDDYGLIEIFRKVWKTGKPAFYPAKLYKDEKYANYYENRVFRLPSKEIVAVYDDITEKTLATIKLQQSEERFELAMKASKDGLYDWNLITNEIYYSPGYKAMLGYKYHELPNEFSVWETLTDPEDVKNSWDKLNKVIAGELDRFEMEFKMKHKDGHWVDVLSRAEVVRDENGKAVRMIGTHVDISDQKRTQNELIEAMNKAKESDRLKSAFLANMSHEIRTPMNGIMGFSNLLKQHDIDLEKRQEYINIIQQSGNRMLNTINDLIDISRIEAGQVEIRNSYINLNEKIFKLYQFFQLEADKKSLKLSYTTDLENEKAQVYTDTEKVYAILSNFLNNAIKFTEKGSIEFGYRVKEDQIEFFVKDTGKGIEGENLDKIFDRFVQADLSLTRAYEGSGLGLSISKAYAELLHGHVHVESEPGKGSTFYLYIPFIREKVSRHITRSTSGDDIKKKTNFSDLTLMIAEDDETSIIYLETLLEDRFNKLFVVNNGKDAIDMIKKHPEIDLILMDVKMPLLDGFSATRQIRTFNNSVKILAQTAYAMESDSEKALEAGCNGYISKPLKEEDLIKLIEKLF